MWIFASIFGVGFVILLFNLIFGGDADADADVDAIDDIDGSSGPSIFSLKMVSMLAVGFGSVGFGMRATTEASMLQSSLAGIGGALVVGIVGYLILKVFYASQYNSTITDNDIIGATANLIDAIPENGLGQVACILRGREVTYRARTADGKSVSRDIPVRIVNKTGDTVTVEPTN